MATKEPLWIVHIVRKSHHRNDGQELSADAGESRAAVFENPAPIR